LVIAPSILSQLQPMPPVQPRSRLAWEATEFAREHGKAEAMSHALFVAFFEHGRDIGQQEVLLRETSRNGK
jgi:predicted DsbA family dithiol-disulfide isomerase